AAATSAIYTLSLHDALPISRKRSTPSPPAKRGAARSSSRRPPLPASPAGGSFGSLAASRPYPRSAATTASRPASTAGGRSPDGRSEEHTSELQSRENLVCRL